jgi:hypothetical protein
MSHLSDTTLQTLYKTAATDRANLLRVEAHLVNTPRAYDLAEEAAMASAQALHQALVAPLDSTGWRRVDLADGKYAEVFTNGGGTTYAVRQMGKGTIFCRTYAHTDEALRAFAMLVYLAAAHAA